MARVIDITSRIKTEPKFIKIGDDSYKVDDRKNTVLEVMQELNSANGTDVAVMDSVLGKLIGKDAVKKMEEYTLENYKTVFIAVMAQVQGVTYEECESSFRGKVG